jgi:hypothetical protein
MITEYFLDESGNTGDLARPGSRFDFGQQEVFALSCLGVADTSGLGQELNRLKRVHRVQALELKSSSVRDKPKFVADLADYIERTALPLMIEVVDKRFMIVANMVNWIVMPAVGDADHTPKIQWVRNVMAEYIHARAPSSVFEAYVAACDAPSGASVTNAFKEFFTWLQREDRNEVSYGIGRSVADSFDEFKKMGPQTKEAQRRFLPPPDIGKRGQSIWMLPNLTSFTNIYARLNRLHRRKIGSITLFHDEQTHFDNILHDAKRMTERLAQAGTPPPMRFADSTFEEQARLVFLGSHASPGIQAADVLAGFVMRHVKDSLFGNRAPTDESQSAFQHILELSEPNEGRGINFVLGTADVVKLGVVPA